MFLCGFVVLFLMEKYKKGSEMNEKDPEIRKK